MSAPQPGEILGWFCSHEDEPLGEKTHIGRSGKRDRNTYRALAFEKSCPRAVPLFARKAHLVKAYPLTEERAS